MRTTAAFLVTALAVASGGCGEIFYAKTGTGGFSGKLTVEWIQPNLFIYRPDAESPLIYTTSDGRTIKPRVMYTDGGSIPRPFWSAPGFGPWDFAPGYIIHDWLFEQHHCREGDWADYDFRRSASVLAEAMKTQMVKFDKPEPTIVWAVYEAVSSPVAQGIWDRGKCSGVPLQAKGAPGAPAPKPVTVRVIDFR
jgi:hypothetical protein